MNINEMVWTANEKENWNSMLTLAMFSSSHLWMMGVEWKGVYYRDRKVLQNIVSSYRNLSPSRFTSKQFVNKMPSFSSQIFFGGSIRLPGSEPSASLYAYATSHSAVISESSRIINTLTAAVVIFAQYRSHENAFLIFIHRDFSHSKNPFNFMLSRSASIVMPSAWWWHK